MNEKLISKRSFVYKIAPVYVKGEDIFVKGSIEPKVMNDLIFYLQLKFHNYFETATLIQNDVCKILEQYYDFEVLECKPSQSIDGTIDLYDNWENNIERADEIRGSEIFYVEGLDKYLQNIMIDVVYTNPTVFCDKFLELLVEKDGMLYIPVPTRLIEEVKKGREELK